MGIVDGVKTCISKALNDLKRVVCLGIGKLTVAEAREPHHSHLARRQLKRSRNALGFGHHKISQHTTWLAVQRSLKRNSVMQREWAFACVPARTQQEVEREHRLERSYGPIALLRCGKRKLNTDTGLTRFAVVLRRLLQGFE